MYNDLHQLHVREKQVKASRNEVQRVLDQIFSIKKPAGRILLPARACLPSCLSFLKSTPSIVYCHSSSLIYGKILTEGSTSKTTAAPKGGTKGAQKAVEKLVTTKGKPLLLFLDEMDQLGDANNQVWKWTMLFCSMISF